MAGAVAEEKAALLMMRLSCLAVLSTFLGIIGMVVWRGLPTLRLEMLFRTPSAGFYMGGGGGILNAIVGSLLMAGGATVIAVFMSIPVAFYLNVFAPRNSHLASAVRISLDLLCGIPSIVYGAFAFAVMLMAGLRASLACGTITLAVLCFPIMARAMDEVLRMVPRELAETSWSLGATRLETALRVILRQATPGLVSAAMLSFGRAVGDAASVLFTAGYSDRVPLAPTDPAASLPLAIFFQLGSPFPEVRDRAYAAALILTILVVGVGLAARRLSAARSRHVVR